ncbi:MAG: DNA-processing protein DprA [Lachnospiraceae bacterium]|nr:DNA-processing protein DprA [Lachnospiraceae bacterium]
MEEILYAYWLSNLDGVGSATVRTLLEYAGSLENIWKLTPAELDSGELKLKTPVKQLILSSRDESAVKRSYDDMLRSGIIFCHSRHPLYPQRLRNIYDPPLWIYAKGRLPDPEAMSIAIVGARNCSGYGRMMAEKLAQALARAGLPVISGMARGIDGIAQEAALEAGGYSCGVLGCGVDICYPEGNRKLYDMLCSSGGLISEYHPGVAPQSGQFPLRNRIISALSDIVIVVEARERSGSLITADQALEQGRDVYALPGRICDSLSQGCNRLIRQGAGVITSVQDFLKEIAVYHAPEEDRPPSADGCVRPQDVQLTLAASGLLSPDEKKLLSVMDYYPKSVGVLQNETGFDAVRLYPLLMQLSMKGYILQQGSHYMLKP